MDYNFFSDYKKTKIMVEGAYKKLKSYLFYDKTLLFSKRRLARFESNKEFFNYKIDEISKKISENDEEYFYGLINEIDFKIIPKKFISTSPSSDIIKGTTDHNQKISRINFFIDLPFELQIVDFLWTLLMGKISNDYTKYYQYAAATKFKKSVFNEKHGLFDGIDFTSNRCFVPYFELYTKWRDGAFETVKEIHQESNALLMCLDLKSFYYSVEFEFNSIYSFFDDDRINSISFLTKIVEKIYRTYTSIIVKYKKGIKNSNTSCVFPIGLTSTFILRELYLYNLDQLIINKLNPAYYSRYVDDINIVIKLNDEESEIYNKKNIVKHYFIDTNIVKRVNDNDLKFASYTNLRIQEEKVNCFYFKKNEEITLLDIYEETVKNNSSEKNLLPDKKILDESFKKSAYNIQNLENSDKIRDLGIVQNNNFKATKFINSLHRILKNTNVDKNSRDDYFDQENYFNQIEEFYHGSNSLQYSNSWRAIFELYLICKENDRANRFWDHIYNEIKNISLEHLDENEIQKKNKKQILRRIKYDLKQKLQISIALAAALNPSFSRSTNIKRMIDDFRKCNFMNHNLVSYPLLNYSSISDNSLIEINLSKLYSKSKDIFKLDSFKLKWSPRFIRANEFYIVKNIYSLLKRSTEIEDPIKIQEKFFNYNNLKYSNYSLGFLHNSKEEDIETYIVNLHNYTKASPKVALLNTKISVDDAKKALINQKDVLTVEFKSRIFNALNIAKNEKVDFIVFPEFYLPIQWLFDISKFAIENNISVISGMQYVSINNKAYNNICMVIPCLFNGNFNSGLVLFREKNHYAPKEKINLAQNGYICKSSNKSSYFVINNGKFSFSTILCYEFTDINARANLKAKVEVLFVPQLNKDTNYFSAIVESASRDLHCFVVQANTSIYGDSRITAPYKTQEKNIIQIKGGQTDVVMIDTIEIQELKNKRIDYLSNLEETVNNCLNCNKRKKHKSSDVCKNCNKYLLDEDKVKGVPPNFV